MQAPEVHSYAHGIHAVDCRYLRPGLAASHIVVRDGRAAFVDTGTNSSVPALLAALAALGIAPKDVEYVFLTHVHLDHAGGAGLLMESLPDATLVVHPRGAEHMADPSRLEAGTRAVYGEHVYDKLYGRLVAVPEERIRTVDDGETLALGSSRFAFLHTPGHALHHVAIRDAASGSIFAGDIFGISYRVFDNATDEAFIFPTTTPTQFDPEQMHASIDRIVALEPDSVYLTHFSEVTGIERLAEDLHGDIDRFVAFAEENANQADPEDAIRRQMHDHLVKRLAAHGTRIDPAVRETWLTLDVRLNAAGLVAWHKRIERKRSKAGG